MKVYVLTGNTDSGDEVGPYVWVNGPDKNEIERVIVRDWHDDYVANTIYWEVKVVKVESE